MHGHDSDESRNEFSKLLKSGFNPISVTFIGVPSACCHARLVETGKQNFEEMKNGRKIKPITIKHNGCIIDLLGQNWTVGGGRKIK